MDTSDFPKPKTQWKHRNGNVYTVLMIANEHSERPQYAPTVVYQGPNGNVWARPASDWHRSMTPLHGKYAVPAKPPAEPVSFEAAWAQMEAKGYKYGRDALEQVRLGWELRGDNCTKTGEGE